MRYVTGIANLNSHLTVLAVFTQQLYNRTATGTAFPNMPTPWSTFQQHRKTSKYYYEVTSTEHDFNFHSPTCRAVH